MQFKTHSLDTYNNNNNDDDDDDDDEDDDDDDDDDNNNNNNNYLLRAIPTPEYWQQCWPSAAAVLGCTMVAITVRILAASIEVEEL